MFIVLDHQFFFFEFGSSQGPFYKVHDGMRKLKKLNVFTQPYKLSACISLKKIFLMNLHQQLPILYFTQKGSRCTVFRNPSFQVRVQLLLVEALSHFATNSSIMKLYLLISSFLGRTSLLQNEVYPTPLTMFKRKKQKQLKGKCFYFLVMMVCGSLLCHASLLFWLSNYQWRHFILSPFFFYREGH